MRIVFDGANLSGSRTGVGYYTKNLLVEMCRQAPDDQFFLHDLALRQFAINEPFHLPLEESGFYRSLQHPLALMLFLRVVRGVYGRIRHSVHLNECDVFFGPNFRGAFAPGLKTVITVHDMAHEYYPETVQDHVLKYFRTDFPSQVERSHLIIAVSETTRRDVINFLNVPEEKVKVVYNGVSSEFRPVTDVARRAEVRQRYALPEHFLLMVGSIQPRKNVTGVLSAVGRLVRKSPSSPLHLVLAGGSSWKSDELKKIISDNGLTDYVHFTGYVPEEDLTTLYSMSDIFLFPSLYEGFGLPVIEAMACGVPVVTSNSSCLPEIAGDAAILVDPHNHDDIADGIERLLMDQELRNVCTERGLARAQKFSWENAGRQLLEIFHEIVGK